MAELITAERHENFKRLKEWVIKCPIEAAMRIEDLERQISNNLSNAIREKEMLVENINSLSNKKETLLQKMKDIHIIAETATHQYNHPQTHRFAHTIAQRAAEALYKSEAVE